MSIKTEKRAKAPPMGEIKRELVEVPLEQIALPEENPARVGCNQATIERYREMIVDYIAERNKYERSGDSESVPKFPFPPVKVKRIEPDEDGCGLEVIGGCHTFMAATEAGLETIEVEICEGSEKDLLIEAIQDNSKHGLRYNNADLRHNILKLHEVFPKMSYRKIGGIVGCCKSTVGNVINGNDESKEGDPEPVALNFARPEKVYDRKRFVAGILRMVEKNLKNYKDVDMFELAKLSGRIIKMLDEKRPDILDYYYRPLQEIVDPEAMAYIDYESDMLHVDDEKRKEIDARRRALESDWEIEDEPEDESVNEV